MPFSVKQKCLEMTEGFYFGQMTEMSPRKKTCNKRTIDLTFKDKSNPPGMGQRTPMGVSRTHDREPLLYSVSFVLSSLHIDELFTSVVIKRFVVEIPFCCPKNIANLSVF